MGKNETKRGTGGGSVAERQERARHRNIILVGIALMISLLLLYVSTIDQRRAAAEFSARLEYVSAQVLTPETEALLGARPAGEIGHVAFLTLSWEARGAAFYSGSGATPQEAVHAAGKAARAAVLTQKQQPLRIELDLLCAAERVSAEALQTALRAAPPEGFRSGISFDEDYTLALLEAELRGEKIYDDASGTVSKTQLNAYLQRSGRDALEQLPEAYILFRCAAWLCDENNLVDRLDSEE